MFETIFLNLREGEGEREGGREREREREREQDTFEARHPILSTL